MWGGNYGDDFRNCKEEKEKNSVFQDYKGERLSWCIWEYFITLLLSSSSLPLYHFLSLFDAFVSVYFLVSASFTLGSGSLSLGLWCSVPLFWSMSPPQISFPSSTLVSVSLSLSLSFTSYMDFNLILWVFCTPLLLGFYPFFFEYLIFLSLCMNSHLSWVTFILFLGVSSFWTYITPFLENSKEEKIFTHYPDFWLLHYPSICLSYFICTCFT